MNVGFDKTGSRLVFTETGSGMILTEQDLGWFVKFGVIVGFHSFQLLAAEQRKPFGGKASLKTFVIRPKDSS